MLSPLGQKLFGKHSKMSIVKSLNLYSRLQGSSNPHLSKLAKQHFQLLLNMQLEGKNSFGIGSLYKHLHPKMASTHRPFAWDLEFDSPLTRDFCHRVIFSHFSENTHLFTNGYNMESIQQNFEPYGAQRFIFISFDSHGFITLKYLDSYSEAEFYEQFGLNYAQLYSLHQTIFNPHSTLNPTNYDSEDMAKLSYKFSYNIANNQFFSSMNSQLAEEVFSDEE